MKGRRTENAKGKEDGECEKMVMQIEADGA